MSAIAERLYLIYIYIYIRMATKICLEFSQVRTLK